jgi:hypothetical protein
VQVWDRKEYRGEAPKQLHKMAAGSAADVGSGIETLTMPVRKYFSIENAGMQRSGRK